MTMQIDKDILEVEQRIARRRMAVELTSRALWHRSVGKVFSPVGMLGAAAMGFLTVASLFRRRPKIVERRRGGRKAGKFAGLLGVAASAGFALLKAQYGSPLHMAQAVMAKVQAFKASKAGAARASRGAVAR